MSPRTPGKKPSVRGGRRKRVGSHDRDLEEARAQQIAANEILRAISASPTDVRPVFEAIARNSVVLCHGVQGAVFQFDGELMHVGALHGFSPMGADATHRAFPQRPTPGMIAARAVIDRAVVQVPDVFEDREFTQRDLAAAAGWRSLLVVPMLRDGVVLGTVGVARAQTGLFEEHQVELLRTFAEQGGIAVTNVQQARALAELNQTLECRVAEQVAQIERLGRLKRFFSPQLAELIATGGAEDPLHSHRGEITVVFLDLRGFTAFAETAEPEELMGLLAEFHGEMGRLILTHEGTLERFTGDGMMVFFNDPIPIPDPAVRAASMAVAMRDRVGQLAESWKRRGYTLGVGIGIAQGYATIGAIGFEGRLDYGAIGAVTNLAARLCAEAPGGQILVSQRVAAAVEGRIPMEAVGPLTLKGFMRPVQAFSLAKTS